MLFTIPYSDGMKVFVDGVETECFTAFDYLMAIKIDEGMHTIEVKYVPEYFYLGMVISLICFCNVFMGITHKENIVTF